jgi:hypothetical protein
MPYDYYSSNKSMKTEFICVKPRSSKAKNRFANMMDSLHSCRVEQRKDGKLFLASITGRYFFWIPEKGDDHWEIIK